MPLMSISMRPGINSQKPLLANEGGWSTSNLVRFKDGCAQAVGGWVRYYTGQLDSPGRTIWSWGDLNGTVRTAVGTSTQVYLIRQGTATTITPLSLQTNPSPDFTTTTGSSTVTVIDSTVGQLSGSFVNIITPVAVGGLLIQGEYQIIGFPTATSFTINAGADATGAVADGGVLPTFATTAGSVSITVTLPDHGQVVGNSFGVVPAVTVGGVTLSGSFLVQSVISSTQFTIDASVAATSAATVTLNGGNAQFVYYGVAAISGTNYAYGVGGYGGGGFGQGSTYTPGSLPQVNLWTMGNWGETLLLCPEGGGIFTWTPNSGQAEAALILEAPPVNNGIFIAMPQLTCVAWGASVNNIQQPLLVSWSTVGDYTQWVPTVTNQAGSQTIPSGSRVVGAIQGPQQALIFTDVDVYAMNYLGGSGGTELAWGFIKLADHCGLIAPRAVCVLNDTVYWLSHNQFMAYNGFIPQPIHCTVWDKIFQDLDWSNVNKITVAPNSMFHEVAWFYPSLSGGTGECDSYVKYNFVEQAWDYGKLGRVGWQDYSPAGNPIGGGSDSYLYQHEIGEQADGQPLNWSLSTGAIMIQQGDQIGFADWLLPEFQWGLTNNPSTNQPVTVTVSGYRFANDPAPATQTGILFDQQGLGYTYLRVRGRHLTMQMTGQGFARIGDIRMRVAPDGRY